MKILAVAAHPDDIELQCAGTLALYARAGHEVTLCSFTSGNMGDLHIKPEQLAATRKAEAEAAAAIIGAEFLWPAIDDECVFPNEAQRTIMIDLLREADPDIVFTHSPEDYHPDHRYVFQLVFDSYFQKGLPHIPGQSKPACRFGQTRVYMMDNLGGINFHPTEYVDIGETFETKKQMLACHVSQVKALKELGNIDVFDMIATQNKFRGFAAGCQYAEGFRPIEAYHRGLTKRILP
jgi:LmbE family N-acetylglucosaminyl deacetylase